MKKISTVTPCFNEEESVRACYEELRRVFEEQLPEYERELVFVDNASTDGTMRELREIAKQDKSVKVLLNARNYGALRSLFNALRFCTGDAVLVMVAVDMQDPPSLLPEFVRYWEQGYKVVYGVRTKRQESTVIRALRWLFYRVVYVLSDIKVPVDAGEFQLIDRQIHQVLIQNHDYHPYVRGLIAECGFYDRSIGVRYPWQLRRRGISKARFFGLIDTALNGIISFTSVPLRIATFVGFLVAIGSFLYAIVAFALTIASAHPQLVPGIATLIVALFFFSGVQLFFIGILGEYVGAIHAQVRRGNRVVVREMMNFQPANGKDEVLETALGS